MDDLPVQPGTYALFIKLIDPCSITIGKLGTFYLQSGLYIYLGSARGSGGLRARLERHLQGRGKAHWHIDYLRKVSEIIGCAFSIGDEKRKFNQHSECDWTQALENLPGSLVPIPGFGASDCIAGCMSHLVFISKVLVLDDHLKERVISALRADSVFLPADF
jgi:Uri superfamily endonuclease